MTSGIGRGPLHCGPLRGCMPRRHRQPQDVGQGARPAVGGGAGEGEDLRGEHDLAGDGSLQKRQPALVLGGRRAFHHEAVDELAGEPHPHPAAGDRGRRQPFGHLIVEKAIEMG